jgi:hypothetical protein
MRKIKIFVGVFGLALIGGWCMNVYKLVAQCDFEDPYKCEFIRTIGIFVPPVGGVAGYFDIEE